MSRTLFASIATAALLVAGTAGAQQAQQPTQDDGQPQPLMQDQMTGQGQGEMPSQSDMQAPDQGSQDMTSAAPANAKDLVGKTAFSQNGEEVGDVSDVLVSSQGQPEAIIIGHGGWLGLGEKQVAIDWNEVEISQDGVVVNMPAQQLSELPEYQDPMEE